MKKEALKSLDIDVYSEKLDNGLEIYLVPFKNFKRYFITYATKYGSLITEFTPHGAKKEIKVPNGIAHFLEHKMFEQEDGSDPFNFFGKSGSYVNASTGYESTRYICSGTESFEENLKYLINFVNSPYFTDENVEKEKGIIIEELNMYKDNPESALDNTSKWNLFHNDPHRFDIGGEVEDVKSITKEDLYLCYDNFYQPNNMFILIVGNFPVEKTVQIIKEKLGSKENINKGLPKVKKYNEPYSVRKEREVVPFNIEVSKLAYMLKLKKNSFKMDDDYKLDLYLNIILKILFGGTSLFSEEAKLDDLFNSFYYSFDTTYDYIVINFYAESTKQNELLQRIKDTLTKRDSILNEEDFRRSKKVLIANKIKASCYIDAVSDNLYEDLINYKKIIYNKVDIIRAADYNTLLGVSKSISLDNNAIVCYVPKKDKDFKLKDLK